MAETLPLRIQKRQPDVPGLEFREQSASLVFVVTLGRADPEFPARALLEVSPWCCEGLTDRQLVFFGRFNALAIQGDCGVRPLQRPIALGFRQFQPLTQNLCLHALALRVLSKFRKFQCEGVRPGLRAEYCRETQNDGGPPCPLEHRGLPLLLLFELLGFDEFPAHTGRGGLRGPDAEHIVWSETMLRSDSVNRRRLTLREGNFPVLIMKGISGWSVRLAFRLRTTSHFA